MRKSVVNSKYILPIMALGLASVLSLYQFLRKDHLNGHQLEQVAYAHIAKSCHEKVKSERPQLDCARLQVGALSYIEEGFIDPNLWSVGAVATDKEGELVWFLELDPTGAVIKSELMYTDPAGNEVKTEENFL